MSTECANPLYLQWLREWWDFASATNAKDRLTYKGAWESMKANPIELTHPCEAIKLKGIGPKLVKRLTERLQKHCQENGLEMPKEPSRSMPCPSYKFTVLANAGVERPAAGISQDDETQNGDQGQSRSKRAKPAPKGYVPKPRSGAYALLLTLAELPEGQTAGLTKAELQIQAQPHADASFTVPPDPSKFHTAWNSMGTLESKHLVYTFGRPVKRYALTEEGWLIAKSMKQTAGIGVTSAETFKPSSASPSETNSTRTSMPTRHRLTIDIDDDDDEHLFERDDFEDRIKRKFGSKEKFQKFMTDRAFGLVNSADDESLALLKEFAERATNGVPVQTKLSSSSKTTNTSARSMSNPRQSAATPSTSSKEMPQSTHNTRSPLAKVGHVPMGTTALRSDDIPSYSPIIIKPGSFTVELVLDSREVRSKTDRNYIQDQFNKAGLRCEQRALSVGDMIWTARIHDQAIINQLELGDRKVPEIVLDYVVERKRLDDLDSSIKDSRFLEQKFRLKRSGIRNAVYIIEDYGSINAMEDQQHTRMVTSIAATQIIDGFFVKRTKKLDDTISYLASMTKVLKEKYESKPLLVIPSSILTPQNHFILRAPPGEQRYITYEALAGLSSKSATLTTRDIFLKMLMCTRGITGDKAIEIQKHWKVPRKFIEAYEMLPRPEQKNEMVWTKAGSYQDKRKIGKAVSQTLAEIWGKS